MKLKPDEWEDLWRRIGAKGDGRSIFQKIAEAYEQKHRFYHNAEHIAECLNELRAAENLAGDRGNEIEMALWLHDFVYDPTRNDNEQLSAVVAREVCREGGLPPDFGARVDDLIMATRHAEDPSEEAAQLVVDIDLSILGKSADRFQLGAPRRFDVSVGYGSCRAFDHFPHFTPHLRSKFRALARIG